MSKCFKKCYDQIDEIGQRAYRPPYFDQTLQTHEGYRVHPRYSMATRSCISLSTLYIDDHNSVRYMICSVENCCYYDHPKIMIVLKQKFQLIHVSSDHQTSNSARCQSWCNPHTQEFSRPNICIYSNMQSEMMATIGGWHFFSWCCLVKGNGSLLLDMGHQQKTHLQLGHQCRGWESQMSSKDVKQQMETRHRQTATLGKQICVGWWE